MISKMEKLRICLDEAIKIEDPIKNIEFIDKLRQEIPHTIKLIEKSAFSLNYYPNYNCHMYALNLLNSKEVDQKIRGRLGKVIPDKEFINYLLNQNILKKIDFKDIDFEDIIIYFKNDEPAHGGRIRSERIISKWGVVGHLWEHGINEAPFSFGAEKKYFRQISKELALKVFFEYSEYKSKKIDEEFEKEFKRYQSN